MRGPKSRERRQRLQEEKRSPVETVEPVVEVAAVNVILGYAELFQIVIPWVRDYDGSEKGKLNFIAKCNMSGLTTRQLVDATWILHDNMRDTAKKAEKARQIGQTAEELWGKFDVTWALAMIDKGGESETFKPILPTPGK